MSDEENEGGIPVNYQTLNPMTNPPPKAQASDGAVSSDAKSDTLTAQQINAEMSEKI